MNASIRREKILNLLCASDSPVSASHIASMFLVSRQVIVGDIALLRAAGENIIATPRGYIMEDRSSNGMTLRRIVSRHTDDRIGEELYTVVDLGGAILDVTTQHSVYGELHAPLHISSRFEADAFLAKLEASDARPLCNLTGGVHLHTIRAADEETLNQIEHALREKGFLLK